ncbi:type II toxin-antitoxin system VapC family toxin [Luteipulveratus halotolerans]|uniref:Ribonuclease VapC n=1 Tax=Luteipulveratus halotolerans TaxID=1631356 RepID=A0A0L6CHN3_9MICO|nr:type II toxin-antitoxin system VapC family toxin [Luteipulveratus halotolerans]KNX37316.1 plasmid stabilization protein [Luteipulveratus halotolerans]
MIVLDTNVVSEMMRARPHAQVASWLDAIDAGDVGVSGIVAAELRAGVAVLPPGQRREHLGLRLTDLLGALGRAVLPFDAKAAGHYGEVMSARRRLGRPVDPLDAQIAATCLAHGATLATRNVKDFEGVGLTLVDPWDHTG